MTAAIALLLMASGAGLLAAAGVLAFVVAAVRSDRADRRTDREVATGSWFWAPLEDAADDGGPVEVAVPAGARTRSGSADGPVRERARTGASRSPRPA